MVLPLLARVHVALIITVLLLDLRAEVHAARLLLVQVVVAVVQVLLRVPVALRLPIIVIGIPLLLLPVELQLLLATLRRALIVAAVLQRRVRTLAALLALLLLAAGRGQLLRGGRWRAGSRRGSFVAGFFLGVGLGARHLRRLLLLLLLGSGGRGGARALLLLLLLLLFGGLLLLLDHLQHGGRLVWVLGLAGGGRRGDLVFQETLLFVEGRRGLLAVRFIIIALFRARVLLQVVLQELVVQLAVGLLLLAIIIVFQQRVLKGRLARLLFRNALLLLLQLRRLLLGHLLRLVWVLPRHVQGNVLVLEHFAVQAGVIVICRASDVVLELALLFGVVVVIAVVCKGGRAVF